MTKITIFAFSLLSIVGFVCSDCEGLHENFYSIVIDNRSDHVMITYDRLRELRSDTILPVSRPTFLPIAENLSRHIDSSRPWEELYKEFPEDSISMHIFFFHPDTIAKYSWEEVRDGYKVEFRYDLSIVDLKSVEYKLAYPPSVNMVHINIYPPPN